MGCYEFCSSLVVKCNFCSAGVLHFWKDPVEFAELVRGTVSNGCNGCSTAVEHLPYDQDVVCRYKGGGAALLIFP